MWACQVLKGLLNSSYLHMLYPATLTASLPSHVCLSFSFCLSLRRCRYVSLSVTNSQSLCFCHSLFLCCSNSSFCFTVSFCLFLSFCLSSFLFIVFLSVAYSCSFPFFRALGTSLSISQVEGFQEWQCMSVIWSRWKTEISQQAQDGLRRSIVWTFMIPRVFYCATMTFTFVIYTDTPEDVAY